MKKALGAGDVVRRYYELFNAGEMDGFLGLLDENVRHDVNQGPSQRGKAAFCKFMGKMNAFYREKVSDLEIFAGEHPERVAAEFVIDGTYLKTAPGLPPARGQKYRLPVGAFFEVRDCKVARITNYYSLQDWLDQVND